MANPRQTMRHRHQAMGAFREEHAMSHYRRPIFINRLQPARRSIARIGTRLGQLLILAIIIGGCSSGLVIRDARGTPESIIPGTTPAFASYLSGSQDQAIVVLVHGVGLHCPMYGLNKKTGWLNNETAAGLNLSAIGEAGSPEFIYDADNRVGGVVDPKSGLYLTRREFTFERADKTQAHVLVAEITWSGLTAWVKNNQLAYDLSDPVAAGKPPTVACPAITETTNPFPQLVPHVIKEYTLDLALSDAVLYVGTYGAKIERGMAEVLCRLTSKKTYDSKEICDWKSADSRQLKSRFIFMTHSIGSRIVYDTLLDLSGTPSRGGTSAFSKAYREAAHPSIDQVVANTKVIYMFANQLPLLGLGNVPVTLRSGDGPVPLLPAMILNNAESTNSKAVAPLDPPLCGTIPIACFANLRSQFAGAEATAAGPLDIVAFSDPNDLLTYGIPPWYVRDVGTLSLHITNVTMQNAGHWLGLFEMPTSAHENYMLKDSPAWRLVRCGAQDGSIGCDKK
jgi:hypothetical protein